MSEFDMTNTQLVRRYESLQKQTSKLTDWFCNNGMGDLRPSDMRNLENPCGKVLKYLKILDEISTLKSEAERRYGPDLVSVRGLLR